MTASQAARSIRQPMDHQPKAPRGRSAKPGTHVQRAIAAYRNRRALTVETYLAQAGASDELVKRYRSAFGRKVANAYRTATGTDPQRSGWAVVGRRLVAAFAYTDRDLLDNVLATYETKSPVRARLLDMIGA